MRTRAVRPAVTALAAAAAARAAYAVLARRPPGGTARWARVNHRGEAVTLLEGPAVALAGAGAASLAAGLPARPRAAIAVAGIGAAAFGCYDDLAGSGERKGFRGHLGGLARGEVTTGAVKIGGIGATGVAAALLAGGPLADRIINAGLVAGGANVANLFDLRPGRAVKAALAASAPLAVARPAAVAAPLGAALALLPEDLGERAMLGDAGANALGAMLGAGAAAGTARRTRLAVLAGLAALTAASEAVSFTRVIERTPPLRWLDMLGRRPPAAAPAASAATAPAAPAAAAERTEPAAPDAAAALPAQGRPGGRESPEPSAVAASPAL
jgi:hypothetical protein